MLSYSTYLGGSGNDYGYGIAVDSSGNAYVTGCTGSTDFPTANPLQATNKATPPSGWYTAFVSELNSTGSALVYSTYLGGSGSDGGLGIAVDSSGNAYVAGETSSTDFPTANPLQATNKATPGVTGFVAKLNAAGSALVYSTYLGGSNGEEALGIAVDSSGNAYVTGDTYSTDFPTANPLRATCGGCSLYTDAFVAKLNAAGSALVYSTYLGGSGSDGGLGIAVDSSGNAYVAGETSSTDFPTANPLQATNKATPGVTGFVAKLNAAGSALVYSTYLGGSNEDSALGIAADSSGNAYVTGLTQSIDFPTVNPLQATNKAAAAHLGNDTAFVAKLNAAGSALVYSTYLGGSGIDWGSGIAVDSLGSAYVTGRTSSTDFPTAIPLQANNQGGYDAFVAELNPAGSALFYSTYLGGSNDDEAHGIAVDPSRNAYVTGYTESTNFPTANPLQATCGGCSVYSDAFVAKISAVWGVGLFPTSLTFDPTNVGDTSGNEIEIVTNTSPFNLTISTVTIGGTNASDFAKSADTCTGATITSTPSGACCTVSVTFTPSATGSRSASLIFTDNGSGSPQTVGLTGTGTAPVAGVSPASLTFTSQSVGTTSASQPLTLSNSGNGALTITGIATSANFGQTNNCGGSVAASGSCAINVTFAPTAVGPLSGTLTITDNSNGVAGSTQTVTLTGTGTPPPVSLSAPSLSFGSQLMSTTSAAQAETVSNTGTANLAISTVTIGGTNASDFAKSADTCTGATITPKGTCTVSVTFTPSATGSRSASLIFTDNASGSPQTVGLTGTGTAPLAAASPATLTFANQPVGTKSGSQPVTLSNTGNGALTITSIATSANFGQTNTCGGSVAVYGSCTINVTFAPTTAGPLTGTLTITDNNNGVAGSTQTVSLTGTGVNPVPTLSALSPSSATAGAAAETLTINGTNFLSTSTVTYNGVAHTPTFVSSTQLNITLSTSDQATAGTYPVVVTNPGPGGGASNSVSFTVKNLVPTITSLSPTSATAGAAAQTLTINGTNFLSTSTVIYSWVAHTPTLVSSTQLKITLSTSDQATAGTYPVVVVNPAPGGGASNSVSFTVKNLVPTITSLSPTWATAGAAAQALTIYGTNFLSTSTVTYNGVAHTPTFFVSSTQLMITLRTSDQARAGTYAVVVTNPAPGGGASNSVSFTVKNLVPVIMSLSPTSATAGAAAQTLTINGMNFASTSTVTYNGVAHTPTFVSSTQLKITLSTSDEAAAGTYAVVVTNPAPGGGASNSVSFTVYLVPTITSLSPTSATAGAAAQALTINGTNFLSTSTVTYNGVAHTPTFVSSTQLKITLSTRDEAAGGTYAVVVTNPAPGGGASKSVGFTVVGPALVETSVTNPPATLAPGGSFSVTDTVQNQGNAPAGPSFTLYYLSTTTAETTSSLRFPSARSVPRLAVNASSSGTVTETIPINWPGGTYFLLACADGMNQVESGNETNNCKASSTQVTVSGPDLVETAVTNPPATLTAGGSFSVTDTVKNRGNENAGASTTRYYLSTTTANTSSSVLLTGSRSVPSLAAGATSSGTVTVTTAASTPAGSYFLLACADDLNQVESGYKSDNCKASSTQASVR